MNIRYFVAFVLCVFEKMSWCLTLEEKNANGFRTIDQLFERSHSCELDFNKNQRLTPQEMRRSFPEQYPELKSVLSEKNPLQKLDQCIPNFLEQIKTESLSSCPELHSFAAWYLVHQIKSDLLTCLWQANLDGALVDNALLALLFQKTSGAKVTDEYRKISDRIYMETAIFMVHSIPGCFLNKYAGKGDEELWKDFLNPLAGGSSDLLKLENMAPNFVLFLQRALEDRRQLILNNGQSFQNRDPQIQEIYTDYLQSYAAGISSQLATIKNKDSSWCLRDVQPTAVKVGNCNNSCQIHALNPNKMWSQCENGAFSMHINLRKDMYHNYPKEIQKKLDDQTTAVSQAKFESNAMLSSDSVVFVAQALGSSPIFLSKTEGTSEIDRSTISEKELLDIQQNYPEHWVEKFNFNLAGRLTSTDNPFGSTLLVRNGGAHYVCVVLAKKSNSLLDELPLFERGHWPNVNPVFCEKYWKQLPFALQDQGFTQTAWRESIESHIQPPEMMVRQIQTLYFDVYIKDTLQSDGMTFDNVKQFVQNYKGSLEDIRLNVIGTNIWIQGPVMLEKWQFGIVSIDVSVNGNAPRGFTTLEAAQAFCQQQRKESPACTLRVTWDGLTLETDEDLQANGFL